MSLYVCLRLRFRARARRNLTRTHVSIPRVRWAGERYYKGTITAWCETTARHRVVYDDGDERDYELSLKTWRLESE